ncbi:hypothetical protein [Lysinibacillus sp. NPDC093688]
MIIKSKAKKEAVHLMNEELELKEIILFKWGLEEGASNTSIETL